MTSKRNSSRKKANSDKVQIGASRGGSGRTPVVMLLIDEFVQQYKPLKLSKNRKAGLLDPFKLG